jgi:hypothetical protein
MKIVFMSTYFSHSFEHVFSSSGSVLMWNSSGKPWIMQSSKYSWDIASLHSRISYSIFGSTYSLYIFMFTPYKLEIRIKFSPTNIFKSFFSFSLFALSLPDPILIHRFVASLKFVWITSIAYFTPLFSVSYSLPVSGSLSLHILRK